MNVYWSYVPLYDVNAHMGLLNVAPVCVYDLMKEEFKKSMTTNDRGSFVVCPAFKNLMKRTYAILAPFDMLVKIDRNGVKTDDIDQVAFHNFISIRDMHDKIIAFNTKLILFSEKSLNANQIAAYMSVNDFTKNVRVIPGSFDISKWFRPLETAFIISSSEIEMKVRRGDPLCYITFDTNEEINLKRFEYTEEISKISAECFLVKKYMKIKKLEFLYDMFTSNGRHKQLLKAIKNNLSEV